MSKYKLTATIFVTVLLSSVVAGVLTSPSVADAWTGHTRFVPIPDNPTIPPNQSPVAHKSEIAPGLNIPKNLIIAPSCTVSCPPVIGTQRDDIIIGTAVTDASIYGLAGDDFIECGPGNCNAYGGSGDNMLVAGEAHGHLFGGSGNNMFIGGPSNSIMVGGKGNDQFFAGPGHDVMIGGGGANFFDCGFNGNGIILDFNSANGDTKAPNCKFVVTVHTNASPIPIPP